LFPYGFVSGSGLQPENDVSHVLRQGVAITGTVTDENGSPLPGVNVVLEGTATGVISDANGKYSISVPDGNAVLVFSFIGYIAQEVIVGDQTVIDIVLPEDANIIEEVVVIGYGTQKRAEISGSVASVAVANLSQANSVSSFDNLLGGAVSGVNITQSSGQPGASTSIRIRGGNSITGGNEPLYVIDGFIMYNDNSSTQAGNPLAGAGLNALATINPADIESIDILKDASATAIYGSRGANGVILITTKKGKQSANHVQYSGTAGWQQVAKKLDLLNGKEWALLRNDIIATIPNATTPPFTEEQLASFDEGFDWQSETFRQALLQNHHLSISGGDDKTQYLISGNYFDQEGIVRNTGFQRYVLRSNIARNFNERFKIGLNVVASVSKQAGVSNVATLAQFPDDFVNVLLASPLSPVYNNDGSFNFDTPYATTLNTNPLADLTGTTNETSVKRTLGNFFAEYKIIPSITAKINAGADLIGAKQNYYAPSFTSIGLLTNGRSSVGSRSVTAWQSEFTLNYNKTFGNHAIDVLTGYTTQKSDMESVLAGATNFLNDITGYHSLQSGSASLPGSGTVTSVLNSWLGRVNYTLRKRYNATVSFRADGSSRFAKNNKWGYFPSIGLSWNISEEDFLRNAKTVSNLKLRLSAGNTGNQEIGDYRYLSVYNPVLYAFGGSIVNGFAPDNISNENLKWETTTQYNAGIDLGLLKDRINVIVDVYYKKTADLLVDVPVPTSSGYADGLKNIGSVANRGIEFTVNADIFKGNNNRFGWHTSFVIAHNENKVLDLGDEVDQFFPRVPDSNIGRFDPLIVKEGYPLGTFWGYRTDGIVQSGENLADVPKPSWTNGVVQHGDRKYVNSDSDANNQVTESDRVTLGNAQPKLIYGFTNVFSYKGIDLVAVLQGSYGNKLFNALKQHLEITTLNTNSLATIADRWTPASPSNEIPRATSSPVAIVTDRLIEDASYLRLKSLTFGYTLPRNWTSKVKIDRTKLFVTAQNLFTITSYSGYDPEVNTYEQNNLYQGIDFGAYPSSRTWLVGLELTF
ncbi:MAG: TonB-dependent receptor, partial [Bacteroidales bacterium]|jgi:TonB-linked SusC/RagA family outer membrane protein|nr:TonB-dependent receptor [Bacteroidales bacterium]